MSGIYIHIPFCKQACHYCNFHFSTSLKYKEEMVRAIIKEIELSYGYLKDESLTSIYFGGGTPSLLEEKELESIISQLKKYYKWDDKLEFTLEANPDDLNRQKVEKFTALGVNRWSLGIQSFVQNDLNYMNRAHNSNEALTALENIKNYGSDNITIDLIYGTPTLDDASWIDNINKAINMGIKHLSCYALTVEEGTALSHFIKTGKRAAIDPEKSRRHLDLLIDRTEDAGFVHYEISNFALPGHMALHNSNYWQGVSYLGIGPAAHSYNGVSRRWNIAHNPKYIKSIRDRKIPSEEELLTEEDRYNEYILTGLRTIWGVDVNKIPLNFKDHFKKSILDFEQQGFVLYNEFSETFTLTREGKHIADFIAMELFVA